MSCNDCPICFDAIGEKNNMTTECGHTFHASCLMTNISRNGFSCPCCRALMVTTNDEQDDDEQDDDEQDDEDDDDTLIDDFERGPFPEHSLRGLRLLTALLEGHEPEQVDIIEEYQSNDEAMGPPVDIVANSLREQGITYEQLTAWILIDHEEYESRNTELKNISGQLSNNFRIIIDNYKSQQNRHENNQALGFESVIENYIQSDLEEHNKFAEKMLSNFNRIVEGLFR